MTGNKVVTFISAYYKRDLDRKLVPNVKYFSIALLNTVKNWKLNSWANSNQICPRLEWSFYS